MKKTKNPQYTFTAEIHGKLKGFKKHLQEKGNSENTIYQKLNYAGYFLKWLQGEHLRVEQTRYNDMLTFIDYMLLQGKSKRLINRNLQSIRDYYRYLQQSKPEVINPATDLNLKGVEKRLPQGIIAYGVLENIYDTYQSTTIKNKRDKCMLGLLIYQGITTGELHSLELDHMVLAKGKVYISGSRKRNSRMLNLKPTQVLDLHEYVTQVRTKILKQIPNTRPARRPDKINHKRIENQLFTSINGSERIKNSLLHLFKNLRKTYPQLKNVKQIRSSVITHWVKEYNLREAQYMAGHKYVSSTERYQVNNLDQLQSSLEKYHPLSNL